MQCAFAVPCLPQPFIYTNYRIIGPISNHSSPLFDYLINSSLIPVVVRRYFDTLGLLCFFQRHRQASFTGSSSGSNENWLEKIKRYILDNQNSTKLVVGLTAAVTLFGVVAVLRQSARRSGKKPVFEVEPVPISLTVADKLKQRVEAIKQSFAVPKQKLEAIQAEFLAEMAEGLRAEENSSSLPMIPTYVTNLPVR